MSEPVLVALISASPPTLAALLGYLANRRTLRRSVGASPGIPLADAVARLDTKIDRLADGQADVRERLARLEGQPAGRLWAPGGAGS